MIQKIAGGNLTAEIILSLAVMLFSGFLVTRVTKLLKLPNVTGYIFAGILLGPFVLNAIPEGLSDGMSFITDIALAYIAFGVGRYFKLSALRRSGRKTIIITLFEALAAMAVVTLSMIFIFRLPVSFALLLGATAVQRRLPPLL